MRTQEKRRDGGERECKGGRMGRCRAVPSAVAQLRQGKTLELGG